MTTSRFTTLAGPAIAEIEVKHSRFLCELTPVGAGDDDASEVAARAVVEAARKQHWDARHHCSAFVLGPQRQVRRSNDDGEPSGTAGAPMLEALVASGLSDVVAVVTRWFGGTLLGAGGLVRAYGDVVRAADVKLRRHRAKVTVRTANRTPGTLASDVAEVVADRLAEVLTGGHQAVLKDDLSGGFYVEPTVFKGTNNMRIFQEEIFGPVLAVTTFKTLEEAIAIANDTEYGLGAGVWSRDMNTAYRAGRAIQAGRVWTNCYHQYPAHAAFGGYKKSGIGRENHRMMLDHYQQTKNLLVSYSPDKLGFF